MFQNNVKRSVLAIPGDVWACGRERIVKPYGKLAEQEFDDIEFTLFDTYENKNIEFTYLLTFDAVLFQRPTHKMIPQVMRELKKHGKKIVIEIDDRLEFVHQDNVASKVFYAGSEANNIFFECMGIADAVHTTTPELADAYKLKNPNIKVFYNAIDFNEDIYKRDKLRLQYPKDQINVMWAGSTSHWDSMKLIKGIIEHAINSNEKANLLICGNVQFFDLFDLPPNKKTYIEGCVDVNEFPIMMSAADIAIAPVLMGPFNDGKSELKCLESAIWGVPTVCSPVSPYLRFNEKSNGANKIVKANKPNRWIKEVTNLINNEEERLLLGQQSYDAVLKHYNIDEINKERVEFWREFLL